MPLATAMATTTTTTKRMMIIDDRKEWGGMNLNLSQSAYPSISHSFLFGAVVGDIDILRGDSVMVVASSFHWPLTCSACHSLFVKQTIRFAYSILFCLLMWNGSNGGGGLPSFSIHFDKSNQCCQLKMCDNKNLFTDEMSWSQR